MSLRRKPITKPHYVDEVNRIVYIAVSSWAESMAAQAMVDKVHPGYKAKISTKDVIRKMRGDDLA